MSRITMHRCDTCGREHEDVDSFKGWIEIRVPNEKQGQIIMHHGRDQKKNPVTKVFKLIDNLDFCSRKCFDKSLDGKLGG